MLSISLGGCVSLESRWTNTDPNTASNAQVKVSIKYINIKRIDYFIRTAAEENYTMIRISMHVVRLSPPLVYPCYDLCFLTTPTAS